MIKNIQSEEENEMKSNLTIFGFNFFFFFVLTKFALTNGNEFIKFCNKLFGRSFGECEKR